MSKLFIEPMTKAKENIFGSRMHKMFHGLNFQLRYQMHLFYNFQDGFQMDKLI